jgi:hypothetical protein
MDALTVCVTLIVNGEPYQVAAGDLAKALVALGYENAIVATATYTEDGSTANYSAELAFDSSGGYLSSAACDGATPPSSPLSIGSLPLVLLLQDWGAGSPP